MEDNFVQKRVILDPDKSLGIVKVEDLLQLLNEHPYYDEVYESFDIKNIKNEFITVDFIDTVYGKIKYYIENYKRSVISSQIKNINVYEEETAENNQIKKHIIFEFDEYREGEDLKESLKAIAIYDSKNTFLDKYVMTKYANHLFKIKQPQLANYNVQYFKKLAEISDDYNKKQNYRLIENKGKTYLRGITSERFYEYGIDFAFVVSMLILHNNMKLNKGVEYRIKSAAINESKLEVIVSEKYSKDAGKFGKVSTAIKISTNDLGTESLNFVNIISVGQHTKQGFYLIPRKDTRFENNPLRIPHNTKPENVVSLLTNMGDILNTSDNFINELNNVKSIKNPDELRVKILMKITGKKSAFKDIKSLSDIFIRKIDNEINNFSKLLEMCNKAEELDIEYDLKDKLRYIISDIILYGNTK